MYIHSGMIKANKKDIEAIKIFLWHAQQDMRYGMEGTYCPLNDESEKDIRKAEKEMKLGKEGLELIEFILKGLCDKWN